MKEYGAQEYIDKNIEYLIGLMKEENFKTPLDVQNMASSIMFGVIDK